MSEYPHSLGCSVTGGFVYRGIQFPTLQAIYFYADFCSGRLWRLQHNGAGWHSQQLLDTSYSISTFGADETGEVYVANWGNGTIYQLIGIPSSSGSDLTRTWERVTQKCSGQEASRRGKLKGVFHVHNEGNERASRSSSISFYLSDDSTCDGNDTLLRRPSVGRLKAGQTRKKAWTKALPRGTSASGQFVIAVVDANQAVAELDEMDNAIVFGPIP